MEITISDEEKEEVKKRVLTSLENRLTQDALMSMQRQCSHEVSKRLYARGVQLLEEATKNWLTEEKIEKYLSKAMGELNTSRYGGDSFLKQQVTNAVLRVTNSHAEAVTKELKTLLYMTLQGGFYEKGEKKEDADTPES